MAFVPLAAAGISALGSMAAGYMSSRANRPKESKMQKTQRKLVDRLIASLGGEGPYSDLFSSDENAFQKSFVNPAKERFNNQIAPQIQQQYLASGQQRGTGMSDQLLRAGVDLNSLLDQHYMDYIQQAQNRKANAISGILGAGSGSPTGQSTGDSMMSAGAGFLASDSFQDLVDAGSDYFSKPAAKSPTTGSDIAARGSGSMSTDLAIKPRRGFQKPLV